VLKSAAQAPLTRLLKGLLTGVEVPAANDLRLVADRDPVALL
jgi:hypothetical protein